MSAGVESVTARPALLARIVPDVVAAEEAFEDPEHVPLFPAEEELIAKAVEKRRREFSTARHCARAALTRLGLPPAPILPGKRGAPQWPGEVVGSMTHCQGYRAAALGRTGEVLTIGIDAEPHDVLPNGVLKSVSLPEEREQLTDLARTHPGTCWDRLLFCAKESIYKAWYPLAGRWLGFEDALVTFEPDTAVFTARLLVAGPTVGGRELAGFTGRFLADEALLVAAIAVPVTGEGAAFR
jgi:4'-phosphopantetheinyl transferase EntD